MNTRSTGNMDLLLQRCDKHTRYRQAEQVQRVRVPKGNVWSYQRANAVAVAVDVNVTTFVTTRSLARRPLTDAKERPHTVGHAHDGLDANDVVHLVRDDAVQLRQGEQASGLKPAAPRAPRLGKIPNPTTG